MEARSRDVLLGPFGAEALAAKVAGIVLIGVLTVFTQLGGLFVWPFYTPILRFAAQQPTGARRVALAAVALAAVYLASSQTVGRAIGWCAGRTPLPLFATQAEPLGPRSLLLALAMRNYVVPDLRDVLIGASQRTAAEHPGTVVRYLDAAFPVPGPLLPHLSHRDGRKVDIAFLYEANGTYVDATPSPFGYWGYVAPNGPTERAAWAARAAQCEGVGYDVPVLGRVSLRWDFEALQGTWPALTLDRPRTQRMLREVAADQRVKLILLEPTLHTALAAPKLQANSCRVARHDDHAHVELK